MSNSLLWHLRHAYTYGASRTQHKMGWRNRLTWVFECYCDWVEETGRGEKWYLDPPKWLCIFSGHNITPDQCNNPDHDYCIWCNKNMPGKANRAK